MVFHQLLHGFQYKIHLKGLTERVRQDLLDAGVQNGGGIAMGIAQRKVGDVG